MPFSVKVNPLVCVRWQLVLGMAGGWREGRCADIGSEEKAAFSRLYNYLLGEAVIFS